MEISLSDSIYVSFFNGEFELLDLVSYTVHIKPLMRYPLVYPEVKGSLSTPCRTKICLTTHWCQTFSFSFLQLHYLSTFPNYKNLRSISSFSVILCLFIIKSSYFSSMTPSTCVEVSLSNCR